MSIEVGKKTREIHRCGEWTDKHIKIIQDFEIRKMLGKQHSLLFADPEDFIDSLHDEKMLEFGTTQDEFGNKTTRATSATQNCGGYVP